MRTTHAITIASLLAGATACSGKDSKDEGPAGEPRTPGGGSGQFDEEADPVPTNASETTPLASERVSNLFDGLADSVAAMEGDGGTSLLADSTEAALGTSSCASADTASQDSLLDVSGLEEVLREAKDVANEYVFRTEFVESDDGTTVTYLIDPATACEGDPECVTELTENPIRFAVNVLEDDSLAVRLLVGADRHAPASMRLGDTALGLTADLAELMDSIELFMTPEDRAELPRAFAGVVDLSLVKEAEGKFTLSLSLLENLRLDVEEEPGKAVSITVAASEPTTELRLDANTNTMSWRQNLSTVDVAASGSLFCEDEPSCGTQEQQGTFHLHLAGATGEFELSSGTDQFSLRNWGFGSETSYLALNDTRLVSVDLNPNAGRTLNVHFSDVPEGILVSFEPSLDLKVATALTSLSESLRADLPEWLLDEVFDVTFGGAPKPSILIREPECDAYGQPLGDEEVEVQSGTLSFAATSLPAPVTVDAGMCVVPVESSVEDPHPFMTIAAGVCE